jgi:NitT/TauT family transport system substrate-binding protein
MSVPLTGQGSPIELPNRRRFTTLVLSGALGVALHAPKTTAQARLEKPKVKIAVGGKSAFYYLPLTIAEQLGFFAAEGLQVEITDFSGGANAVQAGISGAADLVSAAFEHTISLQAKNQSYQSFVLMGRAPQIALGVSTKALPDYKSLADLRGKRIGISAPGSSTNMMANLVLTRAGIAAESVVYVGVGSASSALAAVRSGQVDALCNVDPVVTMLEQKGELRIVADSRTLKGSQEVFGGTMPAACLCASADFVKANPATVQALTHGIVHALKWLQTAGPGDIIKAVPESYLLGDRALYLASFNKVREALALDGLLPEEGARTALRVLARFDSGVVPEKIALSRTYTNEFARRAKTRFNA